VVGSALIDALRATLDADGKAQATSVGAVTKLVASLAAGVRSAKRGGGAR
jgi:tryptophan synthase alpha chain